MFRSLIATLIATLVGAAMAFAVVVFLLEAMHTKDELPNLLGFGAGVAVGGAIAIYTRRALLAVSRKSTAVDCSSEAEDKYA